MRWTDSWKAQRRNKKNTFCSEYPEFVRIGAAFIVNLDYIDSMSAQDISLNTGKKIYLPRGAYKTLKELYFQYYCEEDF